MPKPAIDIAKPPEGEPTWKTTSPRSAFADSLIEGFAVRDTAPRRARADLAFFIEYVFVDQKGVPLKLQWFHKEMIKNLLFEKRVLTLLPRSWGKCVPASTRVHMADGSHKRIEDVKVGDKIFTLDASLKFVKDTVVARATSQIRWFLRVRTKTGREVRLSPEHPVLVLNDGKPTFLPISSLSRGSFLAVPRVLPVNCRSSHLSEAEIRLLGWWIAEGTACSSYKVTLSSPEAIKDVQEAGAALGWKVRVKQIPGKKSCRVIVYQAVTRLLRPLGLFGKKAGEKFVPEILFSETDEHISLFLNRYFAGDGCVTATHRVRNIGASSKSGNLLRGIQILLLRLGIISTLRPATIKYNGSPYHYWKLNITSARPQMKFLEKVGALTKEGSLTKLQRMLSLLVIKGKSDTDVIPSGWENLLEANRFHFRKNGVFLNKGSRLSRSTLQRVADVEPGNEALTRLAHSDLLWDRITSIKEEAGDKGFDLQLKTGNNYIANEVVAHNSVIGSVAYPCWRLGVNRDLRIIIASNTISQAKWWLSEIENVMLRNEKYQEVFGYLVPRPRTLRWTDTEKRVVGRSHYAMHSSLLATGIGSALLGARADIIVIDDIVGKKEAVPPTLNKYASDWLWTVLLNTLEPDGQVVVSGSRWSQDDIYAEIMERWKNLPSEMAVWQKGAFVLPGKYPRDSELYKMEQEGGLDPLAGQELREQAIAEARKAD